MKGLPPLDLPPSHMWPLHLKDVTPVNLDAVRALPTTRESTKTFLHDALRFMEPATFEGIRTSRTIKSTQLSTEDIALATRRGKFEPVEPGFGPYLPAAVHGTNVFTVMEAKGRRRVITEPHVNAAFAKKDLPKIEHPSRLDRRQRLRNKRYMLQVDFEAYYDAIPLPEEIRNNFVFRADRRTYLRLTTLPTGARWSVAVGQGITWVIVDIPTPVTIMTMIDNVLIAAELGQETEFIAAVRAVLTRMREANLLTSPDREELLGKNDEDLLEMARCDNEFLGEEYSWNGQERVVRNSAKTVAKIRLSLQRQHFSHRSFVALVSLMMYALHTTRLNPAETFSIMRAYRAVYQAVSEGADWDAPLPFISQGVRACLASLGDSLVANPWWTIAPTTQASYEDSAYDLVVFTDASVAGWGAVARWRDGTTRSLQQRWVHDIEELQGPMGLGTSEMFTARHSAHAEPRGAQLCLHYLLTRYPGTGVSSIALVTDHFPIVHAQRSVAGFRGIGRGYSLNRLYHYTNALLLNQDVVVTFFYLEGGSNPADGLSRNFGDGVDANVVDRLTPNTAVPRLRQAYCPLAEPQ